MTKKEIASKIFDKLEKHHINLYHDISKTDFQEKLNKFLEFANDLDDIHFDAEMSKLFSLFKDAHTTYRVGTKAVDAYIKCIKGKFYFYETQKQICEEIVAVNNIEIKEVLNRLKNLIQYEVKPWLEENLRVYLRSIKHLQMIDCANKQNENQIEYTLKNNIVIKKDVAIKKSNKPQFYSFEKLDNDILKVDYNLCANQEGYPFATTHGFFFSGGRKASATNKFPCVLNKAVLQ